MATQIAFAPACGDNITGAVPVKLILGRHDVVLPACHEGVNRSQVGLSGKVLHEGAPQGEGGGVVLPQPVAGYRRPLGAHAHTHTHMCIYTWWLARSRPPPPHTRTSLLLSTIRAHIATRISSPPHLASVVFVSVTAMRL
jgi:hypothetical protein